MKNVALTLIRSILALSLLATGAFACTSDAEAVCEAKCDCNRCSDRELDDCYAETNSKEVAADRAGCLDLWDDLKACEADTGFCKSGSDFETSCKPEKDRYESCIK